MAEAGIELSAFRVQGRDSTTWAIDAPRECERERERVVIHITQGQRERERERKRLVIHITLREREREREIEREIERE